MRKWRWPAGAGGRVKRGRLALLNQLALIVVDEGRRCRSSWGVLGEGGVSRDDRPSIGTWVVDEGLESGRADVVIETG